MMKRLLLSLIIAATLLVPTEPASAARGFRGRGGFSLNLGNGGVGIYYGRPNYYRRPYGYGYPRYRYYYPRPYYYPRQQYYWNGGYYYPQGGYYAPYQGYYY